MSDLQIVNISEVLKNSQLSNFFISKYTGFSQASISNWKRGVKKPSKPNALILKFFFENENRYLLEATIEKQEKQIQKLQNENNELRKIIKAFEAK